MFTVTTLDRLPSPVRHKKRALEGTPEWTQLTKVLQKGLKPYQAAVAQFTPDQLKQLNVKTAHRVFLSMAKGLVNQLDIKADVWKYTAEDGSLVVVVADRGVAAARSGVVIEPVKHPTRKRGRPTNAERAARSQTHPHAAA